jgi:hypothetical protein
MLVSPEQRFSIKKKYPKRLIPDSPKKLALRYFKWVR